METLKLKAGKIVEKVIRFNNPYYYFGIPKADYVVDGDSVHLVKLNIVVNKESGQCLLSGYPYAVKIYEFLGGRFQADGQTILLTINGLRFQINSAEELFIIYEVFVAEVYKYCCLNKTIFIDIGMNSAITTLYYASNPLVEKVYAFELFKPTFNLGRRNIELNETLSDKISAFNVGLSNKDFRSTIQYSLSRKGRMGLRGLPNDEQFTDVQMQEVSVRDISVVFDEIISKANSCDVVVKMDCEGEEFNLIKSLATSRKLEKLNVLIIEWHYTRPNEIENTLKDFNFRVFSQTFSSMDSGMIYACRRENVL
jgi:FkbM family methyltransferase